MKRNTPDHKTIAFGLVGAGGFAREVMPIVKNKILNLVQGRDMSTCAVYFIESDPQQKTINGMPLLSMQEFFQLQCTERYFNVAIGDSKVRNRLATEMMLQGAKPMTIFAPQSIIYDANSIDEGAILCANTMITSNVRIGKFFHLNIYSYVAHDCIIGDYVTLAPNVNCNGNIHINDHAYIGSGAILKQGSSSKPLVIGEGAIVGMGAVVTKDVDPFTTVVGNPALLHTKRILS